MVAVAEDRRLEPCSDGRDMHCPHFLGGPTPQQTYEVRCCFCGRSREVSFEVLAKGVKLPDHGPRQPQQQAVIKWPPGWS